MSGVPVCVYYLLLQHKWFWVWQGRSCEKHAAGDVACSAQEALGLWGMV